MTLIQTIERLEELAKAVPLGRTAVTCDGLETGIFVAASNPETILKLCAAVREMRGALEFYGKRGHQAVDIWEGPGLGYLPGKRARETLSKVDAMFEEPK